MQRGLPGVSAEEEALPSERVLSGELLGERRREAFRGMREALGNHADGSTREEFSVAVSLLCPPHLPPGSVGARGSVAYRARECFPGLDGPAAVRAYCEHRDRPHVKALVADMRALEGLDVLAQRGMWRESQDLNRRVLMLKMRGPEEFTLEQNIAAMEPADVARLSLAMTAAMKAAVDFDGLQAPRAVADDPTTTTVPAADAHKALAEGLARVAADLAVRTGA